MPATGAGSRTGKILRKTVLLKLWALFETPNAKTKLLKTISDCFVDRLILEAEDAMKSVQLMFQTVSKM